MEPLTIVLIVLAIVAVWAVAEMAITIRKARAALDEISHSATEAIDQVTPVVSKLDGVVDELQPALREVNSSLGDVSSATHGVAGVGDAAGRIVNTATSAAVGVVSKVASFGGITIPEGQQLIGKGGDKAASKPEQEAETDAPAEDARPHREPSYVSYAPVTAPSDDSADFVVTGYAAALKRDVLHDAARSDAAEQACVIPAIRGRCQPRDRVPVAVKCARVLA